MNSLELYDQLKEQLKLEHGHSHYQAELFKLVTNDLYKQQIIDLLLGHPDIDLKDLVQTMYNYLPTDLIQENDLRYNLYWSQLTIITDNLESTELRLDKITRLLSLENLTEDMILEDLLNYAYFGNNQVMNRFHKYGLTFVNTEGHQITVLELKEEINKRKNKNKILRNLIRLYYVVRVNQIER